MTSGTQPSAPTDGHDTTLPMPAELLHELELALRSIQYGTIELVIHAGRVVQLEKREKVRAKSDVTGNKY